MRPDVIIDAAWFFQFFSNFFLKTRTEEVFGRMVSENESERDGEEDDDDQKMTCRLWVNSHVLWTVQVFHQQGPKHRPKRARSR
jgi:hypothetical protein